MVTAVRWDPQVEKTVPAFSRTYPQNGHKNENIGQKNDEERT
jgi:hypothetical protein